jgi:hypothetical protein
MSFLAPWALVVGVLAAAGAVLLHLVARQRPAAYLLPTTRFIPDRRTLVSRVATRPRDLLLLALRVLLLLSAGAAFARPVLSPSRAPRARLVLLDRSAAVASPAEALARVRALLTAGVPTRLIAFDSGAVALADAAAALDSLALDSARTLTQGSLSAALVAARRLGPALATEADSVELVLVSPVAAHELDAATDSVRARWPGTIRLARLPARTDSARTWTLDRALGADDPLAPALSRVRTGGSAAAVRLRRAVPTAADSAYARRGGAVVQWDAVDDSRLAPAALAMGDDVVVATLGRETLPPRGRTLARWADGSAAATEEPLGTGCIRRVAIGVPAAGDLPLRPAFQRVARGLMAPCGGQPSFAPADSAAVSRLIGTGSLAAAGALAGGEQHTSPLVPWLLGLALICALAELVVRARSAPELA